MMRNIYKSIINYKKHFDRATPFFDEPPLNMPNVRWTPQEICRNLRINSINSSKIKEIKPERLISKQYEEESVESFLFLFSLCKQSTNTMEAQKFIYYHYSIHAKKKIRDRD